MQTASCCGQMCRKSAAACGAMCRRNFQGGGRYMGEVAEGASLVWFSSSEGRELFSRSLQNFQAESYFPLTEQFLTQSAPPNCGPASLAMVLNSLRIDPGRVWKSPWRWFTEETLASCSRKSGETSEAGTTMHEFALMAECNGASAQTFFAEKANVKFFRSLVGRATRSQTQRLVVCFDRVTLGQTGTGHYSPVAAYDAETDRVLILDVARFKYPPYWVGVEELFNAMQSVDDCTGKSRGFFVISQASDVPDSASSSASASTSASVSSVRRRSPVARTDRRGDLARRVGEVLEEKENSRLMEEVGKFVHAARRRMANRTDEIHNRLEQIRSSSLFEKLQPVVRTLLEQRCDKPCRLGSVNCTRNLFQPGVCAAPLLVRTTESRPVDLLVQALPQEIPELAILFLLEHGTQFIDTSSHTSLLEIFPR